MKYRIKTDFPGGKYINGVLISSKWKEFTNADFLKICEKDSDILVEIFENGKFIKKTAPKKNSFKSVAELKMFLIDKKGYTKKEISNLKKSRLLELAED